MSVNPVVNQIKSKFKKELKGSWSHCKDMGQTGVQGVKQDDVTLTLFKVHVNPFHRQLKAKNTNKYGLRRR
jgi:hypothetical protein